MKLFNLIKALIKLILIMIAAAFIIDFIFSVLGMIFFFGPSQMD